MLDFVFLFAVWIIVGVSVGLLVSMAWGKHYSRRGNIIVCVIGSVIGGLIFDVIYPDPVIGSVIGGQILAVVYPVPVINIARIVASILGALLLYVAIRFFYPNETSTTNEPSVNEPSAVVKDYHNSHPPRPTETVRKSKVKDNYRPNKHQYYNGEHVLGFP